MHKHGWYSIGMCACTVIVFSLYLNWSTFIWLSVVIVFSLWSFINAKILKLNSVLQAGQKDRVLSTSEDLASHLHDAKTEPLIRSRPLSDIYPSQNHPDRSSVPYLLSGYGAQVQPMSAGPRSDESKLNVLNSSAWSSSVSCQPEGKPYPSRIMRLFSNSRKGPVPAQSPNADDPTLADSSDSGSGAPQSWSGRPALGVVDSFKKLRSSVLQGIQNRNHDGEHASSPDQERANGTVVNNSDPYLVGPTNHSKSTEGYTVSNGYFTGQTLAMLSQFGSDNEDYDDEDNCGDGLSRNSRLSRSIRRAYGAGRITLFDTGNGRKVGSKANATQKPVQAFKLTVPTENISENTNVKVLSRLSKSAENLHIFKAPFRRKAPSPGPPSPQEDDQSASISNGMPNIKRTSSVSSADLWGHDVSRKKSPVKTKAPMLKLVGSMTDLTVRRRRSASPGPTSPSPMSPSSRLHDDYSRRLPFQQHTSERQRRPLPVTAQATSVEHAPLVHCQPEYDNSPQPHQVAISPPSVEPPETTEQTLPDISAQYESLAVATTSDYKQMVECSSSLFSQRESSQQQEQTEGIPLPNEVRLQI